MGDAEQLQSAGGHARVGRCGFGDGKEVGDTATGRASRLRCSLAGDSRSLAGDVDAHNKDPRALKSSAAQDSLPISMNPVESTESDRRAATAAIAASERDVSPDGANVAALPRKSFSLEQRQCGASSSSQGLDGGQSDRILRDRSDEYKAGAGSKTRPDADEGVVGGGGGVFPRRAFSLEENIVTLMDSPKKTSSLASSLRQREGRRVASSSAAATAAAAEGSGGEKSCTPTAMWRVESRETPLGWTRSSAVAEEEEQKRPLPGLSSAPGIPELIEAFLDDGDIPSSEEDGDDVNVGVAKAKASSAGIGGGGGGGGGETEGLEPDEASSLSLKQREQSQSQSGLAPSLQSTCDVSSWSLCHYHSLPQWMQDNEFILSCHRPPLPSFFACFKSIFRLHTETLNIWTHLLGCVAFVAMGAYFLALPREAVWLQEKLAFGAFFGGGAACFALSSAYHTLWCHSPAVGRLFSKLDYCGIALLIMGSFVPWLYYAFYCRGRLLLAYLALVAALGALAVLVSLWGRFGEPRFRPLRAGVFLAYGLSGVVPALHFAAAEGWRRAVAQASLHWLALMGALYVLGACVYALRVPERFFPGRCDLLFQSHQIFHVFVIAAALVHYHGLTEMAVYRLSFTDCSSRSLA